MLFIGKALSIGSKAAKNPAVRKNLGKFLKMTEKIVELIEKGLIVGEAKEELEEIFSEGDDKPQPSSVESSPNQPTQPQPPQLTVEQTQPEQTETLEMQPVINIVIDNLNIDGDLQLNLGKGKPVYSLLQQQAQQDVEQPGDRPSLFPPQAEFTTLEELRIHAPTDYIDAVIANNAQALVEGIETEQGKLYKSDNFTVSVNQEGIYTISEPQGEILMQFRYPDANSEIPQVLFKGEMSHELHLELLAAQPSLDIQEHTSPVSGQSLTMIREREDPFVDLSLNDLSTVTNVALTVLGTSEAQHFADGRRVYEGSVYRFEQQNDLSISALDGREEIFRVAEGEVQISKLSEADIERFERAANRFYGAMQEQESDTPALESPARQSSKAASKRGELER